MVLLMKIANTSEMIEIVIQTQLLSQAVLNPCRTVTMQSPTNTTSNINLVIKRQRYCWYYLDLIQYVMQVLMIRLCKIVILSIFILVPSQTLYRPCSQVYYALKTYLDFRFPGFILFIKVFVLSYTQNVETIFKVSKVRFYFYLEYQIHFLIFVLLFFVKSL